MTLGIIWTYASLRAFSMIIPYLIIVFVNSWIQLISWLPIQVFGGLGVIDTSQIYLFSLFGISVAQMATISVGLRVTSYLFNLLSPLYLPLYRLFQRKNSLIIHRKIKMINSSKNSIHWFVLIGLIFAVLPASFEVLQIPNAQVDWDRLFSVVGLLTITAYVLLLTFGLLALIFFFFSSTIL